MYTIIGGDGKQYGPISGDDLRNWISEGRVNTQTLVKSESDAEFRALSTFPEFADVFGAGAQPAGTSPPSSPADVGSREKALQKVKGPAVALMVTAILNILSILAIWTMVTFFTSSLLRLFSGMPNYGQIQQMLQSANNPLSIASNLFGLVLSVLILIGATKMQKLRSYEFSMAAAIAALLPCVTPCCCIGIPVGIWTLVVLSQPGVKSQFR